VTRDLELPAGAVVAIAGDASLPAPRKPLHRVMHELIDNALRHAERPDARVEIAARLVDGGWELRVADNGPGIVAGYRERVWHPFATLTRAGGSGLGLAIARRIVEAHGGRTWIEDAPAGGALVCLFWPA
jgi:signal transduction histidine kinase